MNYDENFGFNIHEIRNLIDENIDVQWILHNFYNPRLVGNTVYKSNIGQKHGTWREVSKVINRYLTDNCVSVDFKDIHYFINCAVFYPNALNQLNDDQFLLELNRLNASQINFFYCSDSNLERVKSIFFSLKLFSDINDLVFLQFLLASCASKILSINEELHIIRRYLDSSLVIDSIMRIALERRVQSLSRSQTMVGRESNNLIVLVSGQFRGGEFSIPVFHRKLKNSSCTIEKYCISTWYNLGMPRFEEAHYMRVFEQDALLFVKNNYSEQSLNRLKEQSTMNQLLNKDKILNILNLSELNIVDNSTCTINILDEEKYPYKYMCNSEKMYFHNAFLIEELDSLMGDELILKIRPDYIFANNAPFDLNLEYSNVIYAESPYVFEAWGFGIGDQILLGAKKYLSTLLGCHKKESISFNILKSLYKQNTGYRGHINLGLEAWVNGLNVKKIPEPFLSKGLSSAKKINLATVQNVLKES